MLHHILSNFQGLQKAIFLAIFCFTGLTVVAQDPAALYGSAKKELENGNASLALHYLESCQKALNGSNAKIESLKCQALMLNADWVNAAIACQNYENLIPAAAQNGEAYKMMLDFKSDIWKNLELLEKEKKEKEEREKKEDLEAALRAKKAMEESVEKKEASINVNNEKKLFETALKSKDKDLLELYKEVGKSSANLKTIEVEMDKQKNPNNYVVQAVEDGGLNELSYLIQIGADKNSRNSQGERLIHISMRKKQSAIADYLIQSGADLEVKNNAGETPLHVAIKNDFYAGAEKLVFKHANLTSVNKVGYSPVYYCLLHNQPNILNLLAKKADINAPLQVAEGTVTPLFYAVHYMKSLEMITVLLKNNAEANALSNTNWTPLMAAVYNSDKSAIQILIQNKADVNVKGPNGWTALHFAVRNRNVEIIQLLLSNGASKNIEDQWKRTPTKVAKERRYNEVIKALKTI
ncbi:hypothetical protein MMC2321_03384 [Chitinophaga sp. MM2321]